MDLILITDERHKLNMLCKHTQCPHIYLRMDQLKIAPGQAQIIERESRNEDQMKATQIAFKSFK